MYILQVNFAYRNMSPALQAANKSLSGRFI